MAEDSVVAVATFRAFFTLGSIARQRWVEIKQGTKGLLSEKDPKSGKYNTVTFEYGDGDTASAPIDYAGNIQKADVVQANFFMEA